MSHNYHFVLTAKLKEDIADFAKFKNMSLSKAVKYIFNFMKPVLEKHYLIDIICKKPEYTNFGADADLHVYFKKTDYKYLRQIQSNLYCFSMAKILRWVLTEFFEGIREVGFERFFEVVSRYSQVYSGVKTKFSKNNRYIEKKVQHMFYSIHDFKNICHIFDHEYNLIKTKFT